MDPIVATDVVASSPPLVNGPPVDVFFEILSKPTNALVMAATMALLSTLLQTLPTGLVEHPIAVRLRPLLPLLFSSALIHIPGLQAADMSLASRSLVGLILGAAAGQTYKFWTQGILGRDSRLPSVPAKESSP